MKKLKFREPEDSDSMKLRKKWLKKGIELVDITPHCEFTLGISAKTKHLYSRSGI